jgi:hypothetical protein
MCIEVLITSWPQALAVGESRRKTRNIRYKKAMQYTYSRSGDDEKSQKMPNMQKRDDTDKHYDKRRFDSILAMRLFSRNPEGCEETKILK